MSVKIRRHQHTRVHAHTGPRRHTRAPACHGHHIPRRVRRQAFHTDHHGSPGLCDRFHYGLPVYHPVLGNLFDPSIDIFGLTMIYICCVSVCVLCGSPVWPSPLVVGPLWGPPLYVGPLCGSPLCGSPVWVPCVGPLCGSPLCGSPVWVPCVGPLCGPRDPMRCGVWHLSRDVSRSFTRSRSNHDL